MKDFAEELEDVFESISMEEAFMFIAILVGMMIVVMIMSAAMKMKRDAANAACPVNRMRARVVDKQQQSENGIVVYSRIWVLFELDDGRRVRLILPGNSNVVVGDRGNLTWQGDAIISFVRDGAPKAGGTVTGGSSSSETSGREKSEAPKSVPKKYDVNYVPAWKRVQMEQGKQD